MANTHFGNIGDIWKHLALAEILAIERPHRYWESHAGSASYPLAPSPERDYGIYGFLGRASGSRDLRTCRFRLLLEELHGSSASPAIYPGSPLVAMKMLGREAAYLFCDIDGSSLVTIRETARILGIPAEALNCVEGDGPTTVLEAALDLPQADLARTLVLIDPFWIDMPPGNRDSRTQVEQVSPLDLFSRLAGMDAAAVLWYSFDSPAARAACRDKIQLSLRAQAIAHEGSGLWCGEILIKGLGDRDLGFDPGVGGCGILASGLGAQAAKAAGRLGRELARVYAQVVAPGGRSGALDFEVIAFADSAERKAGQRGSGRCR
jgi:23S rRNA (adenine2030-N6)-methyltransferase